MAAVNCPRQNFQVGKMLVNQVNSVQRFLAVIDRDNE